MGRRTNRAWHRAWMAALLATAACRGSNPDDQVIPEDPAPIADEPGRSDWRSRPDDGGYEPAAPAATSAPRTHVVRKGDTLFSLAREYYNDNAQWRKILEANRDRISNKDAIKVGQELVIPD
ncbi:MAG: LysM peptidoglycan-binding domain-containing protein [Planctomycetes bacterium]|nr:LysM peptidoglycan-binding domain-containing protein [Planctomycetota bacterium]